MKTRVQKLINIIKPQVYSNMAHHSFPAEILTVPKSMSYSILPSKMTVIMTQVGCIMPVPIRILQKTSVQNSEVLKIGILGTEPPVSNHPKLGLAVHNQMKDLGV